MENQRPQSYLLYGKLMTYYILLGMALLYVLDIGLSVFFAKHFIVDVIAAGEHFDGGGIILIAICIVPLIVFPIWFRKDRVLGRFLLRASFDAEGIHCHGFTWKPFTIRWADIRTFGLERYTFSYASCFFLFFNTEREYYRADNKQLAQISNTRIIFDFRKELIEPIATYAPMDIREKILEAAEKGQNCFHQRRAGKDI